MLCQERRFVDVSDGLLALLGYEKSEMVGHHYTEFVHPDDLASSSRSAAAVAGTELTGIAVNRYRKKDGGFRWIEWRFAILGGPRPLYAVGRDITQRKLLEATARATSATLRELSARDYLTGALNRRTFDEVMGRELARAIRHLRPLSLVALDIDHFKKLNDAHGHEAGDVALKAVSDILRGTSRAEDFVFRIGGEEFALLLVECGPDGAVVRARAALGAVKARTTVTLSAGVATFPDHGVTATELAHRADVTMYESKASGRDRVTV